MPRTLDPVLRQGLERANPVVCDILEISAPDATRILRRANDQFLTAPPRVSEDPAATTAADPAGALMLAPTNTEIAALQVVDQKDIIGQDPSKNLLGVGWTIDPGFGRAVLKQFVARIERLKTTPVDLQLQIYRPKEQIQYYRDAAGALQQKFVRTLLEVLPEPVVVRYASIVWVADDADVTFDLSLTRPDVGPGPVIDDPTEFALNPLYLFVVSPVGAPDESLYRWRRDTTTSTAVAGVGVFEHTLFTRDLPPGDWRHFTQPDESPVFRLDVETYPETSQLVYAIDLPTVPLADSTGRIVFETSTPFGTQALLELSTAGAAGPWTSVVHGDVVSTKQLSYHLRLTLNATAPSRQTPRVAALGIDFRVPIDVSAEGTIDAVAHEIQVPYCESAIGEGRVLVLRTGRRDFLDVGSELAVSHPSSKLELDHYLGSRHPRITRDHWFHLDRAPVVSREPGEAGEAFGLMSPLKALKKKIPGRLETINTIHSVLNATANQVQVTPALEGAAGSGDYAGRGYYLRVRSSEEEGVRTGYIQTIDNNTDTDKLDFATALPGVLAMGDVVEVHSAQYAQPSLTWEDADPADVWWELITDHLLIPSERIGFGGVGSASRSGIPPRITDRAPGDTATQAKLRVSLRIQEAEEADRLIDQISFILGGCTVAIAGQYVFRQIYALRDANDQITVPTAAPTRVLDPRDYNGLQTPTGIEGRITTLACDHGVNTLITSQDAQPASTRVFADADAIAFLSPQDVEGLGSATIPKEISRWCYNSADGGAFLADQVTKQVVRIGSTGLRVWSWSTPDQLPELHVGDSVWIVTDQYTDYDPTRRIQLRGWWAYRAILISVQGAGRRFRALLPGLGAAVPVRGGPGTMMPDFSAAAELLNFRVLSDTPTQRVLTWERSALVTEVFAAVRRFDTPLPDDPWTLVTAALEPLAADDDTVTIDKPAEGSGQIVFVHVEPRGLGLTPGIARRYTLEADVPDAPTVETDDVETETLGRMFLKIIERGIRVVAVEVQTQVGNLPFSDWGAPLRGPDDTSEVRGGVLGALEYEHDVTLHDTRLSWIGWRLRLETGEIVTPVDALGFDPNPSPNILSCDVDSGAPTVVRAIGDSDTRSWKFTRQGGAWEYVVDGHSATVDVAKPGTNGEAGIPTPGTWTIEVTAYSEPKAYVVAGTPKDSTTKVVSVGAAEPTWDQAYADAPDALGSAIAEIALEASSAPVGYTAKVWERHNPTTGWTAFVDITGDLAPALGAPPTVLATYSYTTEYPKSGSENFPARLVQFEFRCEIRDAGGNVVATSTVAASWYFEDVPL